VAGETIALSIAAKAVSPLIAVWKWATGRVRQWASEATPLHAELADVVYDGTLPPRDEHNVTSVVCRLSVRNPSALPDSLSSIRLECSGNETVYAIEVHESFAKTPLKLPTIVPGFEAVDGWIWFPLFSRGYRLRFGEARVWSPRLIITFARGDELDIPLPPCRLPKPEEPTS
jgi:hypothetical protein